MVFFREVIFAFTLRDISRFNPIKVLLAKNWDREGISQKDTTINKSGVNFLNQSDKKEKAGSNIEKIFGFVNISIILRGLLEPLWWWNKRWIRHAGN
jgi:hypothetical protein